VAVDHQIIEARTVRDVVALPAVDMRVRSATLADIPFIDQLQKQYRKELAFFKASWLDGYIKAGNLVVAEDGSTGERIGYCVYRDRYLKRDELGYVSQLCVVPGRQRGLVGANLLKTVFERASYGCKLFCCWCAQDLPANRFWESMGFVPIAFRTGSEKKQRIHIYWQKRIRAGDESTPWWFPSETINGGNGEHRIVLPMPPGAHWRDVMPMVVPAPSEAEGPGAGVGGPSDETRVARDEIEEKPKRSRAKKIAVEPVKAAVSKVASIGEGGMRFGAPVAEVPQTTTKAKPVRVKKPKAKFDDKLLAAARELRDRWTDEVASGRYVPAIAGKYEVARLLPETTRAAEMPALAA
jgi:N-acetylglutamate synthase-like GNAT family acetyltransferase